MPEPSTQTPLSKTIRTLVVDDEPLARSSLTLLLRRDPAIELIGEAASGAEALTLIRATHPDLVFLDVQMPEVDGFDVLELLGPALPSAIVFVTAYDQYALRAFEAGALDYLLKPFDDTRFHLALTRAKDRIAQSRAAQPANPPRTPPHLVIKTPGQISFLKLTDIDWIEAADYYTCLHTGAKTHLLRRSMAELEAELDPTVFCRIHRSTIVRLARVRTLTLNENGDYEVHLICGTPLRLSRRYRKELQLRLGLPSSS